MAGSTQRQVDRSKQMKWLAIWLAVVGIVATAFDIAVALVVVPLLAGIILAILVSLYNERNAP